MKTLIALVTMLCGVASFAKDGIWIKSDTGTSPLTAADYSIPANWADGYVPGEGDAAYFTNAFSVSRYVKLSSELSLAAIYAKIGSQSGSTILLGDTLTLQGKSASLLASGGASLTVFANVSGASGFGMQHSTISGDLDVPNTSTVTLSAGTLGFDTSTYATSAETVRYPWGHRSVGQMLTGGPSILLTGPNSSKVALNGVYSVTQHSPILTYVSGTAGGKLVVGSRLSGDGIPKGAYLKRIFSDSYIEISVPAEQDVPASALTFEPLVPEVHLEALKWYLSGDPNVFMDSLGPDTVLRVETWNMDAAENRSLRITRSTNTRFPATWVTHTTKNFKGTLKLGTLSLELAEAEDGETAGFPMAKAVKVSETTRFVVTNGISAVLSELTELVGTAVKEGTGVLSAVIAGSGNTGTLEVKEGVFAVSPAEAGAKIATVKIAAGATLRIPDGVLETQTLQVEPGAVLEGPGVLFVTGPTPALSDIVFRNGATIRRPGNAGLPVTEPVSGAGEVVGDPAFWCAADDTSTMVLDGNNRVSRWNDKRGVGHLFATNIVEKPFLVTGGPAGNYIKFEHLTLAKHWIADEQVLVWSDIVKNIRVIFAMVDPKDGGGSILGRSTRIPDDCSPNCGWRGFFGRESNSTQWYVHMWHKSKQPAGTRIFIDGDPVPADATYREPAAQLVEIHLPAGNDIQADAFGTGASDGGDNSDFNGKLRAHEYIVYTNELTAAERQKVAQYLMKKWLKRDAPLIATVADETISLGTRAKTAIGLDVAAGETVSVGEIGEGELVKGGAGAVYLDSASGGSLRLTGGSAAIRSFGMTAATLPGDASCYLHLDATDDDSMVKSVVNGTNFVTRWNDVRGTAGRYYVVKASSDGGVVTSDGWLHENVMNSKPMVDLGPLSYDGSSGWGKQQPFCALRIKTPSDSEIPGQQHNGADGPSICSIFMAYDSSGGGNALLSARGAGWDGKIGLATQHATAGAAPTAMLKFSNSTVFGPTYDATSLIVATYDFKGDYSMLLRQNGEGINPWDVPFSKGQDVFMLSSASWPNKTGGFGIEGYDNYVGGLMFGEILLYTNFVGQVESKQIEAYLLKKWKGIDMPGYTAATLGRLTLENDATVKVFGGAPLTVTTLNAAGGAIEGAVKLASNAVLEVPVLADGTLGTITLGADFDYSAGATVRLVGNVEMAVPGTYAVVTSPAVTAADAAKWNFTDPAATKRAYAFSVVDGAVRVFVSKFGAVLFLR